MRLVFLSSARRDLLALQRYIARESGSRDTALVFAAKLRERCITLAGLPGRHGRSRPELAPELRSIAFRNYIILFQYHDDTLAIVNIIEGQRDFMGLFP